MNIFTLTLKIKTVSKSGRLYHPNSQKLERVGTYGGILPHNEIKTREVLANEVKSEENLRFFIKD